VELLDDVLVEEVVFPAGRIKKIGKIEFKKLLCSQLEVTEQDSGLAKPKIHPLKYRGNKKKIIRFENFRINFT